MSAIVVDRSATGHPPGRIAAANDRLRSTGEGGWTMVTQGVAALPEATREAILVAVREFSTFDAGNDPHGEHDFGAVAVGGVRCLWKIEAYDRELRFGSPDPADPEVTTRVITIMLAEEY